MAKIKNIFTTALGTRVAELEDGRLVARYNSMQLIPCTKKEKADGSVEVRTCGESFLAGFMMRTDEDFRNAVEGI